MCWRLCENEAALDEVNIGYRKIFEQDCKKPIIDAVVDQYQREMNTHPACANSIPGCLWRLYIKGFSHFKQSSERSFDSVAESDTVNSIATLRPDQVQHFGEVDDTNAD